MFSLKGTPQLKLQLGKHRKSKERLEVKETWETHIADMLIWHNDETHLRGRYDATVPAGYQLHQSCPYFF